MNPHPVANIPQNVQLAAPHAVTQDISGHAVNHDLAAPHRVPHAVLGVSVDDDGGPVHEGGQVLAGHAPDIDAKGVGGDAVCQVALALHVDEPYLGLSLGNDLADEPVQFPVVDAPGVYLPHDLRPSSMYTMTGSPALGAQTRSGSEQMTLMPASSLAM